MATLYDLLAQSAQGEDYYLGQSPYYNAAKSIAGIQVPEYENRTQAFLVPILQGLLVGGLSGYAKKDAKKEAYKDYTSMLSGLNQAQNESALKQAGVEGIGPVADAGLYEKLLAGEPQIKSAEDYSYKRGQMEIVSKILQNQAADEIAQKRAAKRAELEEEIAKFPLKLQHIEQEETAKVKGKKAGEATGSNKGIEDLPASQQETLSKVSNVNESLLNLKTKFDVLHERKVGPVALQARSYIAGTKEEQAMNLLQAQIPELTRALGESGALSDYNIKSALAALRGNITSGPKEIAQRIENLRELINKKSVSLIKNYQVGSGEGGLERLKQGILEQSSGGGSQIPSVGGSFNGQKVVRVTKIR